jgi:hypothetical protein
MPSVLSRSCAEAYAGSVPYEASNMQRGADAAGAGCANRDGGEMRRAAGVRFAKW